MSANTFELNDAVRAQTPLQVGLVSPSGAGKTFSALRLATGIQRVTGGDIAVIDSEARRALHYANKFKFKHMPFPAPFGPDAYLERIRYCHERGARVIVIDSASHEHSGTGGLLEMHADEWERMGGQNKDKLSAWVKPKAAHQRMVNGIVQLNCNFIWCFRAKEKMEVRPGQKPLDLGWMPIMSDDLVFEMTINCLLYPGSNGTPTWNSTMPGEQAIAKLPDQFRGLFKDSPQLTEDIGQALAEWAQGAPVAPALGAGELVGRFEACDTPATLQQLETMRAASWSSLSRDDQTRVKAASVAASARITTRQ